MVVDGVTASQAYTAKYVDDNGDTNDVTSQVAFQVVDPAFGLFAGTTLTVAGGAAGHARVVATLGEVKGDTGLTVYVKNHRVDGTGVPPNADGLFGTATESANQAPVIAYPAEGILVPPNLGEFDVHWRNPQGNNLFEIKLQNQFVDLTNYKAGSD